jgi:hypothetical protein
LLFPTAHVPPVRLYPSLKSPYNVHHLVANKPAMAACDQLQCLSPYVVNARGTRVAQGFSLGVLHELEVDEFGCCRCSACPYATKL